MSGAGSVRSLLLRVGIVVAVLLGLCRWTSRAVRPGVAEDAGATPSALGDTDGGPQQLSAPGDLTFYRTLGSGGGAVGAAAVPGFTDGTPRERAGAPGSTGPARPPQASNKDTAGSAAGGGSTGSGAYIVQVLATRDPALARRTRDRLAARGYPAVVLEDRSGRPVVYRIRAGRYLTRQEAEAAARALRRNHMSPWVLQEGQ